MVLYVCMYVIILPQLFTSTENKTHTLIYHTHTYIHTLTYIQIHARTILLVTSIPSRVSTVRMVFLGMFMSLLSVSNAGSFKVGQYFIWCPFSPQRVQVYVLPPWPWPCTASSYIHTYIYLINGQIRCIIGIVRTIPLCVDTIP